MYYELLAVAFAFTQLLHLTYTEIVDDKLTRKLSNGALLKGRRTIASNGEAMHLYLSIPYAEAPINENRYKAPIPKKKWNGVLDASEYRVSCLYDSSIAEQIETNEYMSEDCLLINVITTERCVDDGQCPVAVFFVGGNYNYGSPIIIPAEELGDEWASNGIIVVTLNNRLGSFGFLNTGHKTSAVKNAGLRDQIEALKWIQKEIGNFGGDRSKVTLMGKGAGAINVDQLAISPATDGYFDKVALIGGAAGMVPNIYTDTNVQATRKLVTESKCATSSNWTSSDMEEVINCLRKKDGGELLSTQRKLEDKSRIYSFKSPMLDGDEDVAIFPTSIEQLLTSRRGVTMLIGNLPSCSALTKIAKKLISTNSVDAWCQVALKYRHLNNTEKLTDSCVGEYSKGSRKHDLINDVAVHLPILESAYTNTANNGRTFLFDYKTHRSTKDQIAMTLAVASESLNSATSNSYLRRAIIEFIKKGNPSTEAMEWDAFDKQRMNYVVMSDSISPRNVDGYHREAVNFWDGTALRWSQNEDERSDSESETHSDKPKKMPNGTWSIEEIKAVLKCLIEDAISGNEQMGKKTDEISRWNQEMNEILKRLLVALKFLETAVKEEFMKSKFYHDEQEERKTSQQENSTPSTKSMSDSNTTRRPPEWQRPTRWTKKPKDLMVDGPSVVIRGKSDDESTMVEVKVPPNAYDHFEDVLNVIDELFDKLFENNTSSRTRQGYSSGQSEEIMNDVQGVVKRSVAGSIYPVILPPGNDTAATPPTIPTVTVTKHWWNSAWFWVVHILALLLILGLIAYTCSVYRIYKKRYQYEHVH